MTRLSSPLRRKLETNMQDAYPGRRAMRGAGFTLIELLVVLAILSLLAAFAGPQLFKYLGGAQSDAAKVQIEALASGIDLYRLEHGEYPKALSALVEKPADMDKWNGPYLRKPALPKDPWGRDYLYRAPGEHGAFDLYSLGADGEEGGEGDDRDVVSWE